ncbi:MAG: hypothetical protein K9M08_19145 [Pirellula sp.]|nr:hypothetical protein [Pirellula sp.]
MQKTLTQTSYRPRITFQDTNVVGNVYFLTFFRWQAECRDLWLRENDPELWHSIRRGESPLIATHWSTRFDDPIGATIGDDVSVSMEFDENEHQYAASATIERITENGAETIGKGSMRFQTSSAYSHAHNESPSGPFYEFTIMCPRISVLNPLDLFAWQGKCRELFLEDHVPESLGRVANRQLALQTTSASVELHQTPPLLDEVRIEMRLDEIKCGQLGVRFDYFALSENEQVAFATGHQRMSSKRYVGSGIVPCPLPTDMLRALQSFTDSKRMLDKIENIIEFALEDDFK